MIRCIARAFFWLQAVEIGVRNGLVNALVDVRAEIREQDEQAAIANRYARAMKRLTEQDWCDVDPIFFGETPPPQRTLLGLDEATGPGGEGWP